MLQAGTRYVCPGDQNGITCCSHPLLGVHLSDTLMIEGDPQDAVSVGGTRSSESRLGHVLQSGDVGQWFCELPLNTLDLDAVAKAQLFFGPAAAITIEDFY